MVSIKLSVLAATAALLHLGAARKCVAQSSESIDGVGSGQAHVHFQVSVKFEGEKEVLDSQDNFDKEDNALNIYDGVQTLKSDKLGGDVLITTQSNDEMGSSRVKYVLLFLLLTRNHTFLPLQSYAFLYLRC